MDCYKCNIIMILVPVPPYLILAAGAVFFILALFSIFYGIRNHSRKGLLITVTAILLFGSVASVFSYKAQCNYWKEYELRALETKAKAERLIGETAPDFDAVTPSGDTVCLHDMFDDGKKYILLDFWSSWCAPCMASIPEIKNVIAQYGDSGLKVVGVNCSDSPENARKAVAEKNMFWDILITEGYTVFELYECDGVPTCFLLDSEGTVIEAYFHPSGLKDILKKYFIDDDDIDS